MPPTPQPVFDLARQAINLAIQCVEKGEALVPFIVTEGDPGAVITIVADSAKESVDLAQKNISEFDARTTAYAFAYDGFITMEGKRSDAIYVEASYSGSDHIYVFVQRYTPAEPSVPVTRIGNWAYLQQNEPRLQTSL